MSSSRRKHSKNRKKKAPKPGDLQPVAVPESQGQVDVLAMMFGVVTSLVLIFGVFGVGSQPISKEVSSAELAARRAAREAERKRSSIEELVVQLQSLKSSRGSDLMAELDICNQRIDVANKIVARKPEDDSFRILAICEKILANVKLYGLDFQNDLKMPGVGERLQRTYSPYLDDSDEAVYRNARVARLTHLSFETIKSEEKDIVGLLDLFRETIERFPQDTYVASMIESHLVALMESDSEYAADLFAQLRQQFPPDRLSPLMEDRFQNVSDMILLGQEDFDDKFQNRFALGSAGREDLVQTAKRLLSKPGGGLHLVAKLNMLGQWLERNAHYDAAIEVFEEIKLAGEQGSVLERFQDRAVRVGKSGLLRCRLDGEKVSYIGVDFSGSELDQDKLNKKVVIVVFWSASSPDSVEYVKAINESGKTLGNKPIVVLAVCVDEDIPMDSPVLEGKSRAVRVVPAAYRGGFNSLLQRCPPVMLPHVMLIGFDGVVSDVNIEPMEVRDKALSLLLNRNR